MSRFDDFFELCESNNKLYLDQLKEKLDKIEIGDVTSAVVEALQVAYMMGKTDGMKFAVETILK